MNKNQIIENGEVNLTLLLKELLFKKRSIKIHVFLLSIMMAATYLFLLFSEREYLVTASLAPVSSSNVTADAGSLNSVSNLLGITIGGGTSSINYEKFLELLYSERAAETYIALRDPRPDLYGDNFDIKDEKFIKLPISYYIKKFIFFLIGRDYISNPNAKSLAAFVNDEVEYTVDRKTQFLKISMLSSRPEFAEAFIKDLVEITDNTLKIQQQEVLRSSIDYLKNQFVVVNNDKHRLAISNAITSQEIQISLIQNNIPFAAEFIQNPSASVMPVYPKISSSILSGLLTSLLLSSAICLLELFSVLRFPIK